MNEFKKKMNEKIKQYSKREYLDNYIKKEFLSTSNIADIYLTVDNINELIDPKTSNKQTDLNPEIYDYIERKTSMLENDIQIKLHIKGISINIDKQNLIRQIVKQHYAIELYKIEKAYIKCRNKIITLLCLGLFLVICYIQIYGIQEAAFIREVFSFIFSFSIWEACDLFIYNFSEIKNEREAVTQNLLINIDFDNQK